MDIVGYALIKKNATTGTSAIDLNYFTDKVCRVLEFGRDGCGVMIINAEATGIATFDKEDILSSFRCSIQGDVICPPDLDPIAQMMYSTKCLLRKGGYNNTVRHMVIMASIHKGVFTDHFLWQRQ